MTDKQILAELEQETGIRFKKSDKETYFYETKGEFAQYESDSSDTITGISIYSKNLWQIPKNIFRFKKLQKLTILRGKISEIPDNIEQLKHLQELKLGFNDIYNLPEALNTLENLRYLSLTHNRFTTFPQEIQQMPQLHFLSLEANQIENLPDNLHEYYSLHTIQLANNKIDALPASIVNTPVEIKWTKGRYNTGIILHDNPVTNPPTYIIKQGKETIQAYFQLTEKNTTPTKQQLFGVLIKGFFLKYSRMIRISRTKDL